MSTGPSTAIQTVISTATPAAIPTAIRRGRRALAAGARVRGFTLLEILVVLVILGVIISAATLSFGVLGGDRQTEDETRRLWAVLQQAREEAQLQGQDVALFVSAAAYEFLRYDTRRTEWLTIDDDSLYRMRQLPAGLRYRLWVDGREVVLKPDPVARDNIDQHRKWPPQIMVLSSGEIMPFELHTERDAAPALWRILSTAENDLRLETRKPSGDWIVVAQTRQPQQEKHAS